MLIGKHGGGEGHSYQTLFISQSEELQLVPRLSPVTQKSFFPPSLTHWRRFRVRRFLRVSFKSHRKEHISDGDAHRAVTPGPPLRWRPPSRIIMRLFLIFLFFNSCSILKCEPETWRDNSICYSLLIQARHLLKKRNKNPTCH